MQLPQVAEILEEIGPGHLMVEFVHDPGIPYRVKVVREEPLWVLLSRVVPLGICPSPIDDVRYPPDQAG